MNEPNYTPPDISLVGDEHVRRYRETDGEVGHEWNGVHALLLTTTGRRSREPRTAALIYGRDGEDHVVVASLAGAPQHPNWYHNLVADPSVQVQVGAERFSATARSVTGEERERLWAVMSSIWPNYDDYASRNDRLIPVVVLQRA